MAGHKIVYYVSIRWCYTALLGTNLTDAENSRRELEKFIGPYFKMLQSVLANKTLSHSNTWQICHHSSKLSAV